jgi:hypothetical protein
MLTLSPKLGEILIKATQTTDLEAALRKVLREYFVLKLKELNKELEGFEAKWNMPFDQFKEKCEKREIDEDMFSYDVEKTFWDWERIDTLKKHYETLSSQWI